MFFEELVEQHRVHRFVAHCVRFPIFIARHQVRVYLFHLFSPGRRGTNSISWFIAHASCVRTCRAPARREQQTSSNRKLHELGWTLKCPNFASGMEKSVLPAAGDCLRDS